MFVTVKRLAQDSFVYGLGEAANKLVAFLLIPLYTRFLTTEDYGVMSIVLVLLPLLADAVNLGIISAFYRFYFDNKTQDRGLVTSTAFFFNLFSSAFFLLLIFLLTPTVSLLSTGVLGYGRYFEIGIISLFFDNLNRFGLAILRVQRRTCFYVLSNLFRFFLTLILNVYFVAVLRLGVMGILWGQLIAVVCMSIVTTALVSAKELNLLWSFDVLREMLAFGIPLLPINLAAWVINSMPILLLARLSSLTETGLYTMGYKFASIISVLVVGPFQLGWVPIAYSIAENQDMRPTYSRIFTYFCFVGTFASLGVSLLTKDVLRLVATPKFYAAYEPVFLIAISYVLHGMIINFAVIINISKKTHWNSVLWTIACTINIGLNYLFIPIMAKLGAAIAGVIAYLIIVIFGYVIVQKLFPLRYEGIRLVEIFGAGMALYLVSLIVRIENVWISLMCNLALACSYLFVLRLLGFYVKEEWNIAFSMVSKLTHGRVGAWVSRLSGK